MKKCVREMKPLSLHRLQGNHLFTVLFVLIQNHQNHTNCISLILVIYFGEASFLSRWLIVLLCSVGGGNNRCYDIYRNSLAEGPTLWISPPHLCQMYGAAMSTSPCPTITNLVFFLRWQCDYILSYHELNRLISTLYSFLSLTIRVTVLSQDCCCDPFK